MIHIILSVTVSNAHGNAIEHYKAEGYDIELVYEVMGFPGTDGTFEAGQAAVLDNPEIDGLFSSLTALMWIGPMQEAGRFGYDAGDKRIVVAAAGETMSEAAIGMFGAGFYVGTATEIIDMFGLSIPMIINAVDGHAEQQRENGEGLLVNVGWWKVTNVEDAGYYGSVQGGDNGWASTPALRWMRMAIWQPVPSPTTAPLRSAVHSAPLAKTSAM